MVIAVVTISEKPNWHREAGIQKSLVSKGVKAGLKNAVRYARAAEIVNDHAGVNTQHVDFSRMGVFVAGRGLPQK